MNATGASDSWHVLFDAICRERGFDSNTELASVYCKARGQASQKDFEAAMRNLSNWREGRNLPRKENFRQLTGLMKLDEDQQMLERWNNAYARARGRKTDHVQSEVKASPGAVNASSRLPIRMTAMVLGALMTAGLGVAVWRMNTGGIAENLGTAEGHESRVIGYLPFAELSVGESVLVHAKRGPCGKPPPTWAEFRHEIPQLRTGRLVDDGLGQSRSTSCGGLTPGRLVRFVAERPGKESFELFQREIVVMVKPGTG